MRQVLRGDYRPLRRDWKEGAEVGSWKLCGFGSPWATCNLLHYSPAKATGLPYNSLDLGGWAINNPVRPITASHLPLPANERCPLSPFDQWEAGTGETGRFGGRAVGTMEVASRILQ